MDSSELQKIDYRITASQFADAAEAMARPKIVGHVKIGAIVYEVLEHDSLQNDDGNDCYGETLHHLQQINLWSQVSPASKYVTLWEEIIHAILINAGYNGDHDERMVSALAHGIAQVLIDNNDNELIKPWPRVK